MKIANRDARQYVQKQHPFEGSNLYAQFYCVNPSDCKPGDSGYVVYSYGEHWPLFVCFHINGQDVWFENEDSHSRSTARHRSQSHPHVDIQYALSTERMIKLVTHGYTAIARDRVAA